MDEASLDRKVAEAVAKAVAKANAERDKEFAKLRGEFEAKANTLVAERDEFEAKANALFAEKTMASAREKLLRMLCSPSSGTLSDLLEGIHETSCKKSSSLRPRKFYFCRPRIRQF